MRAFTDLVVDPPGPVNVVAVTFRARLHDGITHTLDPWKWPSSSWATSVWVFLEPVYVGSGSALRAYYHRRAPGKPYGSPSRSSAVAPAEAMARRRGCRLGATVQITVAYAIRLSRCSPTLMAFAIAVRAGFTAPMLGKKLVSTT